ncbi:MULTISPECIES: hypothetical protein [unclassified Streptomyces]|nr:MULTISPECIES: hypothetical protein [unclassified Streptomyces]
MRAPLSSERPDTVPSRAAEQARHLATTLHGTGEKAGTGCGGGVP